ncbi:hypothetical protein CFRS1_v009594 [Colletotrichum fructicola]|nr:hypothetical protein CFRS1_v009594 [Colletotrichum fructicola]
MIAESGGRRLLQYYKQRASGKKEELPLVALEWAELHCQLKDLTSAELTEIVQSLVLCGTLLCGEQSLRDFNSTNAMDVPSNLCGRVSSETGVVA